MAEYKKKIIVVDDNDDILDLIELYLFQKYDIFTAQNGFEAIDLAQNNLPDCIITDIMMPVMDGIRFFNKIQKIDILANVPVIATTSFIKKMSRKSLLAVGFADVVAKPFGRSNILSAIDHCINKNEINKNDGGSR